MKTTSIYSIKVRFAFAVKHEEIQNMFTGASKIERVPTGEVHIFEFVKIDGAWSTVAHSFCGSTHSSIALANGLTEYDEKDKRPEGLKMCAKCEEAWKQHPRSPWLAFTTGKAAKVDA